MKNCFKKYLEKYGNVSLKELPLTEVDLALISVITYLPFERLEKREVTIKEALPILYPNGNLKKERLGLVLPNVFILLFGTIASLKRYQDIMISDIGDIFNPDCQFFAITFKTEEEYIISIRGTDDTISGWIENIVPLVHDSNAQIEAAKYVEQEVAKYQKEFYIIGHSKGANLAEYAYLKLDQKGKVKQCISFDGPGFLDLASDDPKLYKIKPKNSIVGNFFNDLSKNIKIVDTRNTILRSHETETWLIEDKSFKKYRNQNKVSKFQVLFNEEISKLTLEDREKLVSEFLDLSKRIKAKTLLDLKKRENIKDLRLNLKSIDKRWIVLFKKMVKTAILHH